MEIKNKVVYLHRLKCGKVVYVGSGSPARPYAKVNRSDEHLRLWMNITIQILKQNLSLEESQQLEQKIIDYYGIRNLLNKKGTVDKTKTYFYEELSKLFYIDDDFLLRWKIDRFDSKGRKHTKAGTIAGYSTSKGYRIVSINYINYQVHRIIWCIYNKQDIPNYMLIDHIDRNPANNRPSNLRIVTAKVNQQNKTSVSQITGLKHISFDAKRMFFQVQITLDVHYRKQFNIKRLIRKGLTYQAACDIQLKNAIDYRNSLTALESRE